MRNRLLWLIPIFFPLTLKSQQAPVYSQFFMNPYLYNPAYAGVDGHTVIFLMHRRQWIGINDAPQYSHVVFHTPLPNNLGIGAELHSERLGPLFNNSFRISGGYLIPIDRKHFLRFGLSLGAGSNAVDIDRIGNASDPALTSRLANNFYLKGDFGVLYHFGKFNIGFSLPDLIGHDVVSENSLSPLRATPINNVLFKANYRQSLLNDVLAWEPHVLYRYTSVGLNQYEITNIFHIKHMIWLGASYRQDAGIVGLAGIKIAERLAIGYAYDLPATDLGKLSTGSHELHVGFHIGGRKHHVAHAHSFVYSHAKTKEEREKEEAEKLRLAAEEAAKEQEKAQTPPDEPTKEPIATAPVAKPGWEYVSENNGAPITREIEGQAEEGVTLARTNAEGKKEYITSFIPEATFGSEETWSLENTAGAASERTNSRGQKEVGVVWNIKREDGSTEKRTVWSPVYSSAQEMKQALIAGGVNMDEGATPDAEHNFQLSGSKAAMPKRTFKGEKQVGYVFSNTLPDGTTENATIWTPAPDQATGERWELAEANEKPVVRIGPNGEKELGVILRKIHRDGTEELMVEYEPVKRETVPEQVSRPKDKEKPKPEPEKLPVAVVTEDVPTKPINVIKTPPSAKTGNNMIEMPKGHYVVVGAFSNFDNAEKYSDRLLEKGYFTQVGFYTPKNLYYVIIFSSQSEELTRSERDRVRQKPTLNEAWLLTVE